MRLLKQSPRVLVANFAEGKVIFDLETYLPYTLNPAASLIWNFLAKPRRKAEVINFLQKKYNLDILQARQDTRKFIRHLKKRKLICTTVKSN